MSSRLRHFLIGFLVLLPAIGSGQGRSLPTAAQKQAALQNPASPFWKTHAPDTVTADVETSRGTFVIEMVRAWAPHAADRFYNLARAGYYDDSRFYRVIAYFIAQFGLAGNPATSALWSRQRIAQDSLREPNLRGTISFAQNSPRDRTTNVFVNMGNSYTLDSLKFVPFAHVIKGMEVVDSLYSGYGGKPIMNKPDADPKRLARESNRYLDAAFPKLDRLRRITIRTGPR